MTSTSSTLAQTLSDSPYAFLQPSLPLYTDTLAYLKHALDPLAKDVSALQQQRQQEAYRKRKRGDHVSESEVLRLKQVHTEGFGIDQVWEQARRVIESAAQEAERGLEEAALRRGELEDVEDEVDGLEQDSEDESLGEEGVDYEIEGPDDGMDEEDEDDEIDMNADIDGIDEDDMDIYEDEDDDNEPAEEFVTDKFGLNDGFFSIDNFNRQSEFLEQQDARGDDDGAASDEEDVDWNTNPLGQSGTVDDEDQEAAQDDEDDEDEGDGPTFGDPDAPSEDEDDDVEAGEMDDMGGMANTNEIMYKDFFAPPASKKKKKNKKGRPNPHNFPEKAANADAGDDDMERTMSAVHRDLFEDESEEEEEEEGEQENLDPGDPRSRRSAHERRQAAIAEEIRKLEAANVAKREWTLSGEARAADRPMNSLLEEDLEFERTGKPVPVITAEISESIEDLIKRRILAHDFQDIIRRRPDDLATGGKEGRRGRLDFELDNEQSKKGLAEEYEEEHLRRTDPNFVDVKDEKVKKEEKEIEALWKKVCNDLDSLSSWHFRPKQAAPQLDIRVDAPTISMEDARPNAGGEVAGASQLAPQEVYKGGEAAKGVREEVVGKSGLSAGKEEMSREDKRSRRRRNKERAKKAGQNAGSGAQGKGAAEKNDVIGDLKRGNVKVIGKKGQMQDVEGKEVRLGATGAQNGAGQYKL